MLCLVRLHPNVFRPRPRPRAWRGQEVSCVVYFVFCWRFGTLWSVQYQFVYVLWKDILKCVLLCFVGIDVNCHVLRFQMFFIFYDDRSRKSPTSKVSFHCFQVIPSDWRLNEKNCPLCIGPNSLAEFWPQMEIKTSGQEVAKGVLPVIHITKSIERGFICVRFGAIWFFANCAVSF